MNTDSFSLLSNNEGIVLRQESIGTQKLACGDGTFKDVHLVAKNLPFIMEVSFPDLSLHRTRFSAVLLYDNDGLRPVDRVRQEPLNTKIFVNECGNRATVECRIGVLTSQHEDSLFRVKVTAESLLDPTICQFVLSSPIWTVSKSSQGNKVLQKKQTLPISAGAPRTTASSPSSIPSPSPPTLAGAKRNSNGDPVLEALERLERKQEEQQNVLNMLFLNGPSVHHNQTVDFEQAFQTLINAYHKLPMEERRNKVRKLVGTTEHLNDLLDLCSTATNHFLTLGTPELEQPVTEAPRSLCLDDCFHRKELEDLYDQFIQSPISTPEI